MSVSEATQVSAERGDVLTYPHFTPQFPRKDWVLPRVLEHQARIRPDRPCLSWTDQGPALSYAEVNAAVNRIAHGFRALGVRQFERVVIYLPNCLEYVLAWFALQKLGAVEVTIGDVHKGSFLVHQLGLAKSRFVLTTPGLMERLVAIEDKIAFVEHCILVDADEEPVAAPTLARLVTSRFEALPAAEDGNPAVTISDRDPAAVLFTSGTTGLSKGVVMPHSHFYFFAEEQVQLMGLGPDDVYMTGFPLFHGNAQFMTVYPCLLAGAHCVLYRKFSASDFIGRARRSGATLANLIGATMAFICAQPPQPDDRDHRMTRIYAAPLSVDLAEIFRIRFGVTEFLDGFGQTEISNVFMTPRGAPRPDGACGVLVEQWFEVKIADPETDEAVAEGEVGELLVRHKVPGTMLSEYLGMPEKTVEAWRNLWFHTGDALRRDAQGWYYFVDRVKDALRRRGENISSFEVEAVVRSHPAVADCAVIAVKADFDAGEDEVKACVVPQPGAEVTPEALTLWCDERMANFMVPRYIEFLDDLPRTPSEKIRKKELRELGVTAGTWDRVKAGMRLPSEARAKAR